MNAKAYEQARPDFLVALQILLPVSPPRFSSRGVGMEREVGLVGGFSNQEKIIYGQVSKGAVIVLALYWLLCIRKVQYKIIFIPRQEDQESGFYFYFFIFLTWLIILSCPS